MTKIIIDTNIIFSALLNTNSRIAQILINGDDHYDFYSPEYVRSEIYNHKEKIKIISKMADNEFLETFELVLRNITILNHTSIPVKIYKSAELLCKDIDIDDTIFVATAEFIEGVLWTGDLKLINGLTNKGYKRIITTEQLFQDFIKEQLHDK